MAPTMCLLSSPLWPLQKPNRSWQGTASRPDSAGGSHAETALPEASAGLKPVPTPSARGTARLGRRLCPCFPLRPRVPIGAAAGPWELPCQCHLRTKG